MPSHNPVHHHTMDILLEAVRLVLRAALMAAIVVSAAAGIARLFASSPLVPLRYLFAGSFAFFLLIPIFFPVFAVLDRLFWGAIAWAFWFLWRVLTGSR